MSVHQIISVLLAFVLLSCGSRTNLVGFEEGLYNRSKEFNNEVSIYQHTEAQAELHFSIDAGQLIYQAVEDEFAARVSFDLTIISKSGLLFQRDTMSFNVVDKVAEIKNRKINGYSSIPLRDTVDYRVQIVITDLNSMRSSVHKLDVWANADDHRFVKVFDLEAKPLIYNFIPSDESFLLESPRLTGHEVAVEEFVDEFPLPLPPFSVDQPAPYKGKKFSGASVFRRPDGRYEVSCPKKRVCKFTDVVSGQSVSLRQEEAAFPKSTDLTELIEVLRFITTKDEYEKMKYSDERRAEFESFWLSCAGDRDRARNLIAEFYHRVEEANTFFTDHVDGWRTDRGIVHIIYGSPGRILREKNREIWVYGSSEDSAGLQMTFLKANNPFSENDLRLDRSLDYKASWYMAVEAWRNGRIVNF